MASILWSQGWGGRTLRPSVSSAPPAFCKQVYLVQDGCWKPWSTTDRQTDRAVKVLLLIKKTTELTLTLCLFLICLGTVWQMLLFKEAYKLYYILYNLIWSFIRSGLKYDSELKMFMRGIKYLRELICKMRSKSIYGEVSSDTLQAFSYLTLSMVLEMNITSSTILHTYSAVQALI